MLPDVVGKIHLWFRDLARVEDYQIGSHPRGDARLLRVLHPPKGDGWVLPAKPAAFEDRITAVFDLDETLVHSSRLKPAHYDFILRTSTGNDSSRIYVQKRPGVDEFLSFVSDHFELIIFTASGSKYANDLCDALERSSGAEIHGRLSREDCSLCDGFYVKDLRRLGRDLSRTFIVDNSPQAFRLQPENAVLIVSFFGDAKDEELYRLLRLMKALSTTVGDIRQKRKL